MPSIADDARVTTQASRRRTLSAVVLGLLAAWLSLVVAPAIAHTVGPARVRASLDPGRGSTQVELPPLGNIVAGTHLGPVDLRLQIAEVDFEELGPLATTVTGREQLRDTVEADVKSLARYGAVREIVAVMIIGALLGAAFFHRRWGHVALVCGVATSVVGAIGATALLSYRVEAFEQPRFTGTLIRAREVVDTIQRSQAALDEASSRYQVATRKFADLIALTALGERDARPHDTVLLHVSDIHANPIGLEVTRELAREFEVDAVIDTGDLASSITDTGEISTLTHPIDRQLVRSIERMRTPYYFVRGNHDPPRLVDSLERARGVRVLDGTSEFVDAIEVLGWADPTFSTTPIPPDEKAEQRRAVGASEVRDAVIAERPDVLAVHDERLAEDSYGEVPLVIAGHSHARDIKEVEGTRVLTVGSTGATGVKSFAVEADLSYEAEILYFDGDDLVALDYVSVRRLGSDFELERRTFDD